MKYLNKQIWTFSLLGLLWSCVLFAQPEAGIVSGTDIQTKVNEFIESVYKGTAVQYKVEPVTRLSRWIVGHPVDSIKVFYKQNHLPKGYNIFTIKAYSSGRVVRSLSYSANVNIFRKVLVATRPIRRGTPITRADVKLVKKDITHLTDIPLTDWKKLKELIPSRTISRGKILVRSYFRKPYLIHRGGMATLRYDYQNITIELKVQALQNGEPGEVIWFKDPRNHKRYKGRVVGKALAVLP